LIEALEYSEVELMACVASRTLEDKKSVFVGTGLPIVAAILAQKTHAPSLLLVFEAGGMAAKVPTLPISVGDSRTFHKAVMASSMDYVMSAAQSGYLDYGFLGAAQIDSYGNINTTVIGAYEKPTVRLPGSGGGNDVGSLCRRTIVLMRQDKRRFVQKLDFITTPGYLTGPNAREKAGLPVGTGPYRVITQLGVMGFDNESKKMTLESTYPNVSVEQVRASTGFELLMPERISVVEPPTKIELEIIRNEIDPAGIVVKKC